MGRSKNLLNNDWHGSELSGEKRSPPRSPIAARKRQRWSGSHWLGRGLVVISVAILGIPTACSEGPVAPTKQNLKPSAMIVCDPSTNCGDNGINPYDSYVIGDITAQTTATYSSSTAFYDPGSGTTTNSITVSSPPREYSRRVRVQSERANGRQLHLHGWARSGEHGERSNRPDAVR